MKKRHRYNRRNSGGIFGFIIGLVCLTIAVAVLLLPDKKTAPRQIDLSEHSSVSAICELATLKSFYHNVAMFEKQPEGGDAFFNDYFIWPFGEFTKVGYKQLWLEYSGIVETGIDAGKIQINRPDENGVIEVFVPDAKVLSVYADEQSLSEPLTEKGAFTTISGAEQADAFSKAQKKMREEAESDEALLDRAKRNAKVLLEQYIVNTGKEMGVDYSVKWLDNPL